LGPRARSSRPGHITFDQKEAKGPIAKFLNADQLNLLREKAHLQDKDSVFFVCAPVEIVCAGPSNRKGIGPY